MKLLTSLFFVIFISNLYAQGNQFTYEYKFKMDSLNREKIETETLVLETSNEGSKFYSYTKFVYDSTITARIKKADMTKQSHFDFTGLKNSKVNFSVTKKYPEFKTLLRTSIGSTNLTLENSNKLNWKIESKKDKVLGYNVQMATTQFQGRKWVAWFTNDIPIQDGPYCFWGLPGLILKIQDAKGDHSFTIIASKKITQPINKDLSFEKKNREIVVSEEKFNTLWNDYKKDPAKDFRQSTSANSSISTSITFNGKTYSQEEMLKEIEREGKEKLKTENNFIELKMYK